MRTEERGSGGCRDFVGDGGGRLSSPAKQFTSGNSYSLSSVQQASVLATPKALSRIGIEWKRRKSHFWRAHLCRPLCRAISNSFIISDLLVAASPSGARAIRASGRANVTLLQGKSGQMRGKLLFAPLWLALVGSGSRLAPTSNRWRRMRILQKVSAPPI